MMKRTRDLKQGDVMQSGEVVVSAYRGKYMGRDRMIVTLDNPKTGKQRIADWNHQGTVAIKESK